MFLLPSIKMNELAALFAQPDYYCVNFFLPEESRHQQ